MSSSLGGTRADPSDNNDEMDNYIEAQLDKKKSQGGDGGDGSGPTPQAAQGEDAGETSGAQPSLAMKPTKLD